MALTPIDNITQDEVGQVVQDFVDNGIKILKVEKQQDGLYKVTPLE